MNKAVPYRLSKIVVFIGLSFLLLWYLADIPLSSLTLSNLFDLLTTPLQKQDTIELYKQIPTATTKL